LSSEVTVILGAGLSGLSMFYHLNKANCEIFEKSNMVGGHIFSEKRNGVIWDQGPHVSFTKNEYVRTLFAKSVEDDFEEFPVETASFFKGKWIPHPAQSNLYTVPQPYRDQCLEDFLKSRDKAYSIQNYKDWLIAAFGKAFYDLFPKVYTQKYWTVDPELLTTDWVGERIFYPSVEEVKAGYNNPLPNQTHYIKSVRYPSFGGYSSYKSIFEKDARIHLNHELEHISFENRILKFTNGMIKRYDKLVSTLPLPILISLSDAPQDVKLSANKLLCSSVLLINVLANHSTLMKYNWMYVYDLDKYSTRINCSEKLSPNNAPKNHTAIQVEVYYSNWRPLSQSIEEIKEKVMDELVEMGLLKNKESILDVHTKNVPWANVIFDHHRRKNLDHIFEYLEKFGYKRHDQELLPMTDWSTFKGSKGVIQLAGRYAEWKYYWTDDCVLRGRGMK
jgi:protoporphyrinogen oxidase